MIVRVSKNINSLRKNQESNVLENSPDFCQNHWQFYYFINLFFLMLFDIADAKKAEGNTYFAKKMYKQAIDCYTEVGIDLRNNNWIGY